MFLSELHHILAIHCSKLGSEVVKKVEENFKGSLKAFFEFCLFNKSSFS